MAGWVLVPCLVKLRTEFNTIAPNRSKGADGSIGDTAHQQNVSDHNDDEVGNVPIHDADHIHEVHALDITTDLNEPGLSMEACVQHILANCRRTSSDPRNEPRLRYIIFNRRIWRAPGWAQETYTGTADPHTGHAHFSAEYITGLEGDTSSWTLEELSVALTAADKTWLSNEIREAIKDELLKETALKGADGKPDGTNSTEVGHNVLSQGVPNPFDAGKRSAFYKVLEDTAEVVKEIKAHIIPTAG